MLSHPRHFGVDGMHRRTEFELLPKKEHVLSYRVSGNPFERMRRWEKGREKQIDGRTALRSPRMPEVIRLMAAVPATNTYLCGELSTDF